MSLHKYRCPSCRGKIEVSKIYDDRYLMKCGSCGLLHVLEPELPGYDEAYIKLLDEYDEGLIKEKIDIETLLETEGILKSESDIERMVGCFNLSFKSLPNPLKTALKSRNDFIVTYKFLKPNTPAHGTNLEELSLNESIINSLKLNNILNLFKFQEQAIQRILKGENVVIVAPTGSGKTEAFTIPLIQLLSDNLERHPRNINKNTSTALFIYPTKALARDQLPKLRRMAGNTGVNVNIFDGDSSSIEREKILVNPPEVLVTNFDILHYHMMYKTSFSKLLERIRYVVVDEFHIYTGTFGANVHFILKRLERLSGKIQYIGASATINNPREFAETLFGVKFSLVEGGEGKHGPIHFGMIFPSMRSHKSLTIDLTKKLTSDGYRTLCFSSSHLGAELTAFYGKLAGINIDVHRAGLLTNRRKIIENDFKRGKLNAISSTPTLELGIDVGIVDSVVSDLVTVTRLIQRTGRAGRRGQESIAFLALKGNDPISQYYKNNPDDYFKDIEYGFVDPTNQIIAENQILAAALDKPLSKNEFATYPTVLDNLRSNGLLIENNNYLFPDYQDAKKILRKYNIRGSGEPVLINLEGKKIGERNMPIAMEELHPHAIYFLGGRRYKSKSFEFRRGAGVANVETISSRYPYYTRPLIDEWSTISKILNVKRVLGVEVAQCDLIIEKKVVGYVNIELGSDLSKGKKVVLEEPLEYKLATKGIAFRVPNPETTTQISKMKIEDLTPSSFHATEHVIIEGSNMITGGVASDMGGLAMGSSGIIFVYDRSPGGNGASRLLFDRLEEAFKRGHKILQECPCISESGCPRCTYSYRCGNNNEYLYKQGAEDVLSKILAGFQIDIGESMERERTYV